MKYQVESFFQKYYITSISLLLDQFQALTDGVAPMCFKEAGNAPGPLVVPPKVARWTVDSRVCQPEGATWLLDSLEVHNQQLAPRLVVRPVAEGVQDWLVKVTGSNKPVIV